VGIRVSVPGGLPGDHQSTCSTGAKAHMAGFRAPLGAHVGDGHPGRSGGIWCPGRWCGIRVRGPGSLPGGHNPHVAWVGGSSQPFRAQSRGP
jgi:hypothetical protein